MKSSITIPAMMSGNQFRGREMKIRLLGLIFCVSLLVSVSLQQAAAVTNITYQQDQAKVNQTLQRLESGQKELLASLKKIEVIMGQISKDINELKKNTDKNGNKQIELALKQNASMQGQAINQLANLVNQHQEKNLKALELIYQLLSGKNK